MAFFSRLIIAAAAGGWALVAATLPAAAQDFPRQAIQVVVPMPAGGPSDTVVRLLQRATQKDLPHPMVVVNMAGAGTSLGSRKVATSPADGYTLLMNHEGLFTSSAQGIFSMGLDSLRPVAMTGLDVYTVTVQASSPYRTLADLYKAARSKGVNAGVNIGGLNHLTSILVGRADSVEFQPVPYRGNADALSALLGGHIDVIFSPPSDVAGYIETGDLRILAVLGSKRIASLPDVPTAIELGYDVVSELSHMWWVPAGTPDEVVATLARILQKGFEDDVVRKAFEDRRVERVFLAGDDLQARVDKNSAMIQGLVKELGLGK